MCSRRSQCLFDRMGTEKPAVALLGSDKLVAPSKTGFASGAAQSDGRHMQEGFFRKHRQMPYRPHAIISFTNDILIGLAYGAALFVAKRSGFDVKFFGNDGANMLNL